MTRGGSRHLSPFHNHEPASTSSHVKEEDVFVQWRPPVLSNLQAYCLSATKSIPSSWTIPTLTPGVLKDKLPCLVQGPPAVILSPTSLSQAVGASCLAHAVQVKAEIHTLYPNVPSARGGGVRDTAPGSPKPRHTARAPDSCHDALHLPVCPLHTGCADLTTWTCWSERMLFNYINVQIAHLILLIKY